MKRRPPSTEHLELLAPLAPNVQELTLSLREMVLAEAPEARELPYEVVNAVAVCYTFTEGDSEAFIHLASYPTFVNLAFNKGSDLADPGCILRGEGLWIRYVRMVSMADAERSFVQRFIKEAVKEARSAPLPPKPAPETRILTERVRKPRGR